jgi:uncharacterized membrane protein
MILSISAMFLTIIVLDYIWLGIVTKQFLIKQFGSLVTVVKGNLKINLGVGIATWLLIAIGAYLFVVRHAQSFLDASLFGALFGLVLYGVYDLTNLTFITKYPKKFAIVDIVWGTFVCASICGIGFLFI